MTQAKKWIKLSPTKHLSKEDPLFWETLVTHFPHHPNVLLGYAKKLEAEGKEAEAISYYQQATAKGSIRAKTILRKKHLAEQPSASQATSGSSSDPPKRTSGLFWAATGMFFLYLFLLLSLFTRSSEVVPFAEENHSFQTNTSSAFSFTEEQEENNHEAFLSSAMPKEHLHALMTQNALYRFYEINGTYPDSLEELIQPHPHNYLSFVSDVLVYQRHAKGFSLSFSDASLETHSIHGAEIRFELHFFPEENQLSLVADNQTLAVFPVASGSSSLPFSSSAVTNRVVHPNGANSAFGTRGLALTGGYAIHGTNKPDSIGSYGTHGCLRMHSEDIESLYPYISLGTPFKVKEGTPATPLFPEGLPVLQQDPVVFLKETTPHVTYNWKG